MSDMSQDTQNLQIPDDAELLDASQLPDTGSGPSEGTSKPRPKRASATSAPGGASLAGLTMDDLQALIQNVAGPLVASIFTAQRQAQREDAAEAMRDARMPSYEDEIAMMRRQLASEPRIMVTVPIEQLGEGQESIWCLPQINGYTFPILRGEPREVPESIYLNLVCAGIVPPLRTKDKDLRPARPPRPLRADDPSTYISRQHADQNYAQQSVAARNGLAAHTVHAG